MKERERERERGGGRSGVESRADLIADGLQCMSIYPRGQKDALLSNSLPGRQSQHFTKT